MLKPISISADNKYYWSTGDTTNAIYAKKEGSYKAYTYSQNGCIQIDSFVVSLKPVEGIITNINICQGNSLTLKAAAIANIYTWNTGDTIPNIFITKAGTYWVSRGKTNCFVTDSFYIKQVTIPSANVKDTFYCSKVPIIIGITDAQNYVWNTTEKTPQISINKPGMYWVFKTNPPCETIDTFKITENPLPFIKSLQDTCVCFAQIAKIALDAGPFKSYLWKPTNETNRIIYCSTTQTYLLQVTDSNNCVMSKQITVSENCEQHVYIPNAFTPNEDGINDVFNIVTTGVESYEMTIFNRWGQEVFSSQNFLQSWDGKNAPNDVYVVQITYKIKGKPTETIKGNVTLMR